jgi:hypothetical protein
MIGSGRHDNRTFTEAAMQLVQEKFEKQLLALEAEIMRCYREQPEMLDYDVADALDALIARYAAEKQGREPRLKRLADRSEAVVRKVRPIAEWLLGRGEITMPTPAASTLLDIDKLIMCLKQLRKSVDFWTKRGGRRGYLDYVSKFI